MTRHSRFCYGLLGACLPVLSLTLHAGENPAIRVLKLSDGVPFQMGKVDSRRILHPEMGAKKITLNYSTSEPGHEFPQHVHDYSDDTFLVLQGQVDVRQGDSRKPLLAGQAAFVPSGQIHGTVTSGTGTAILISFQCPPDLALYTGARDSSRPGAAAPKGVITPGAVKFLNFAGKSGYFSYPETGSKCVAAARRGLEPGEKFVADVSPGGEEFLFIWKGGVSVRSQGMDYKAHERDTVFLSGAGRPEVRNDSPGESIVIQVQAPPVADRR